MCYNTFTTEMNFQYNETCPNLSLFHLCPSHSNTTTRSHLISWFPESETTTLTGPWRSRGGPPSLPSRRPKAQGLSRFPQSWGLPPTPPWVWRGYFIAPFNSPARSASPAQQTLLLPPTRPKGISKLPQVQVVKKMFWIPQKTPK